MNKSDVLRDRNYYRMLSDHELFEIAEKQKNELALVLAERRTGRSLSPYGYDNIY